MIAAWMLYCALCALGASVAAALAERALLAGRAPVRHAWTSGIALSLLVPLLAFRFAASGASPSPVAPAPVDAVGPISAPAHPAAAPARPAPGTDVSSVSTRRRQSWDETLARADGPLAIAWLALSSVVALYLVGGVVALAWMRRRWSPREVLGCQVFVAERTGPAVVGVVRPAIVLPAWALAMEPGQLELMVRHELEHKRAGDGRLLIAAQLAVVVMPWNPGLWWQLARLRAALELDCDGRVLRTADPRSYGALLLEVARPRHAHVPGLIGATAFAERATQLERRIRALARHHRHASHASRAGSSVAVLVGGVAIAAAWAAPRPRVAVHAPVPSAGQPARFNMNQPALPDRAALAGFPVLVAGRKPPRPRIQPVAQVAALPASSANVAVASGSCLQSSRGQQFSAMVDSAFDLLFGGITLTVDQEAKACDLLASLDREQAAQDQSMTATLEALRAKSLTIVARRDSSLRALLTNDPDRALFDAHAAQASAPGGRGRSGGAPLNWMTGGRGVPSSATAGGRGGAAAMRGRGGIGGDTVLMRSALGDSAGARLALSEMQARFREIIADATFHRLFDGITLTSDQESAARALLLDAQRQLSPPPPPSLVLRVNLVARVVAMQPASAAALLALVPDETDRAKVESRIRQVDFVRVAPR